jgi:hypothetical protein
MAYQQSTVHGSRPGTRGLLLFSKNLQWRRDDFPAKRANRGLVARIHWGTIAPDPKHNGVLRSRHRHTSIGLASMVQGEVNSTG